MAATRMQILAYFPDLASVCRPTGLVYFAWLANALQEQIFKFKIEVKIENCKILRDICTSVTKGFFNLSRLM